MVTRLPEKTADHPHQYPSPDLPHGRGVARTAGVRGLIPSPADQLLIASPRKAPPAVASAARGDTSASGLRMTREGNAQVIIRIPYYAEVRVLSPSGAS